MANEKMAVDVNFDDYFDDPSFAEAFEDAEQRDKLLTELRSFRKQAKLTQKAVAEAMGSTQSSVSDFEHGGDPYISTLQRYARAIGVRLRFVIDHPESNLTVIAAKNSYTNTTPPAPQFGQAGQDNKTPHRNNAISYPSRSKRETA